MRFLLAATLSLFFCAHSWPQAGVTPSVGPLRQINGQVRLGDRPAPQGVLVLLDFASNDTSVPGNGELARTMTDSSGRFVFEHLEQTGRRAGRVVFSVTAHFPGYKDSVGVVDLTFSPRGFVALQLVRDRSRDPVNVAPEGASATISAHQPATPEAQQALARGVSLLFEKHDPKASIEEFRRVIKLDEKYEPAYDFLGTAYLQSQQWRDAQSAFEKAAKLEPGDADAYLGLGVALNTQLDFSAARKALLRSLELKPNSAATEYEIAKGYWGQGNWQEAEPHAKKAIEIDKNFAMSHIVMGNIYLRRRDATSALKEFEEYLRVEPQGAESAAVREMVARIQNAMAQR